MNPLKFLKQNNKHWKMYSKFLYHLDSLQGELQGKTTSSRDYFFNELRDRLKLDSYDYL